MCVTFSKLYLFFSCYLEKRNQQLYIKKHRTLQFWWWKLRNNLWLSVVSKSHVSKLNYFSKSDDNECFVDIIHRQRCSVSGVESFIFILLNFFFREGISLEPKCDKTIAQLNWCIWSFYSYFVFIMVLSLFLNLTPSPYFFFFLTSVPSWRSTSLKKKKCKNYNNKFDYKKKLKTFMKCS
jgi:hypothetical protein